MTTEELLQAIEREMVVTTARRAARHVRTLAGDVERLTAELAALRQLVPVARKSEAQLEDARKAIKRVAQAASASQKECLDGMIVALCWVSGVEFPEKNALQRLIDGEPLA